MTATGHETDRDQADYIEYTCTVARITDITNRKKAMDYLSLSIYAYPVIRLISQTLCF